MTRALSYGSRGHANSRRVGNALAWPAGWRGGQDWVLPTGRADIGGHPHDRRPQRRVLRTAFIEARAFPEPGPVMRWPGKKAAVSALSRSGEERSRREASSTAPGGQCRREGVDSS
jgi:hypothetical protein